MNAGRAGRLLVLSLLLVSYMAPTPAALSSEDLPGPDLVVDMVSWMPAAPAPGDEVTFMAVLRNAGTGPANMVAGRWSLDGGSHYVGADSVAATIEPGASRTFVSGIAGWTAETGAHRVRFQYYASVGPTWDPTQAGVLGVPGGSSGDQTLLVGPDLHVARLSVSPSSSGPGRFLVEAVVRNGGSVQAPVSEAKLEVDGERAGENAAVPVLPPGGEVPVSWVWAPATPGTHTLLVRADASWVVAEAVEDNNTRTLSADAFPDLRVDSLTWTPTSPTEGDRVTLRARVRNDGFAESAAFTVAATRDGTALEGWHVNALAPGATADVTWSWTATAGDHAVSALSDTAGDVAEADESNNEATRTLSVAAADPGEDDEEEAEDEDEGDGGGSGDEQEDGSGSGDGDSGGGGTGGSDTSTGSEDNRGGLSGDDSAGDTGTLVGDGSVPGTDLQVSGLSWIADESGAVRVSATLSNAGGAPSIPVRARLMNGDEEVAIVGVPALSPLGSTTLTWNWNPATPGPHDLTVEVEGPGLNPQRVGRVTVLADVPPSDVEKIRVRNVALHVDGDRVRYLATVANEGTLPAEGLTAAFLLDGEELGRTRVPPLGPGGETTVESPAAPMLGEAGDAVVEVRVLAGERVLASEEAPAAELMQAWSAAGREASLQSGVIKIGAATAAAGVLVLLVAVAISQFRRL